MRNFIFLFVILIMGCSTSENPLETALASSNPKIQKVMNDLDKHEVQILFTEIIKSDQNEVSFKDFSFQVNDSVYFYPASSVKFPAAVLALEKLAEIDSVNIDTPFQLETDSISTTVKKEIEKIFAVSDNEAYNRLFELIGKDEFNRRLNSKGIPARIAHRLSVGNADDLINKAISFDGFVIPQRKNDSLKSLSIESIMKGIGYMEGDSLIGAPKDFSRKNYVPVSSLHNMMKRLMYPNYFKSNERFQITEETRKILLNIMKSVPRELNYDPKEYYDGYVKFFILGDTKKEKPDHLDIYNKVGYAYGYLTDCAYIVDHKAKKEYILTATIHVNENQIFNDDQYEYEEIGIPFLAELGRQLTNQ